MAFAPLKEIATELTLADASSDNAAIPKDNFIANGYVWE